MRFIRTRVRLFPRRYLQNDIINETMFASYDGHDIGAKYYTNHTLV